MCARAHAPAGRQVCGPQPLQGQRPGEEEGAWSTQCNAACSNVAKLRSTGQPPPCRLDAHARSAPHMPWNERHTLPECSTRVPRIIRPLLNICAKPSGWNTCHLQPIPHAAPSCRHTPCATCCLHLQGFLTSDFSKRDEFSNTIRTSQWREQLSVSPRRCCTLRAWHPSRMGGDAESLAPLPGCGRRQQGAEQCVGVWSTCILAMPKLAGLEGGSDPMATLTHL